jgi:hypothetical protein
MGKSRRKTKIFGMTLAKSEKEDKRHCNRALRRKVKSQLSTGDYETPMPLPNEVVNIWSMDKDGKQYWPDAEEKDMRK